MTSVRNFLLLTAQIKAIGVQKVFFCSSGSESPLKVRFQRVEQGMQVEKGCVRKVHLSEQFFKSPFVGLSQICY